MLILSTDKYSIQVIYGTKPHKNPLVKPVNGNSAIKYCGLSHKSVDNQVEDPVHCARQQVINSKNPPLH